MDRTGEVSTSSSGHGDTWPKDVSSRHSGRSNGKALQHPRQQRQEGVLPREAIRSARSMQDLAKVTFFISLHAWEVGQLLLPPLGNQSSEVTIE